MIVESAVPFEIIENIDAVSAVERREEIEGRFSRVEIRGFCERCEIGSIRICEFGDSL